MKCLKDFNKNFKGYSLWNKIKELFWQIRYAWQRAWRGYDNADVFNLDVEFTKRMLPILKNFKQDNIGCWYDKINNRWMTLEETNSIVQKMIDLLEHCDENEWLDMNLNLIEDKDYELIKEIELKAYKNRKEFLKIFSEWFDCLWI